MLCAKIIQTLSAALYVRNLFPNFPKRNRKVSGLSSVVRQVGESLVSRPARLKRNAPRRETKAPIPGFFVLLEDVPTTHNQIPILQTGAVIRHSSSTLFGSIKNNCKKCVGHSWGRENFHFGIIGHGIQNLVRCSCLWNIVQQ